MAPLRRLRPGNTIRERKRQQRRGRLICRASNLNLTKITPKNIITFFKHIFKASRLKILAVSPSIPVKSELPTNDQIGVVSVTAADGQHHESESNH